MAKKVDILVWPVDQGTLLIWNLQMPPALEPIFRELDISKAPSFPQHPAALNLLQASIDRCSLITSPPKHGIQETTYRVPAVASFKVCYESNEHLTMKLISSKVIK